MNDVIPYGNHFVVDRKGNRPVPLKLALIRKDVWDPMMGMAVGEYSLANITKSLRDGLNRAIRSIAQEVDGSWKDGQKVDRRRILDQESYRVPNVMIPDHPGRVGLATSFVNFAYLCATRAILQEDIEGVIGKFAEICLMRILMGRLNREWSPSASGPQMPRHKVISDCYSLFAKLAKKAAKKDTWGD